MSRPRPEILLRGRVDAVVAATTLADRLDTFVALARWTRPAAGDNEMLDELLNLLDDPRERRTFHAAMAALMAETDGTNVFADAGIPTERAIPAELGERVDATERQTCGRSPARGFDRVQYAVWRRRQPETVLEEPGNREMTSHVPNSLPTTAARPIASAPQNARAEALSTGSMPTGGPEPSPRHSGAPPSDRIGKSLP